MQNIEKLEKLPPNKQKELQTILTIIHQKTHKSSSVEMVILFGSYTKGEEVEDKYIENHITYE